VPFIIGIVEGDWQFGIIEILSPDPDKFILELHIHRSYLHIHFIRIVRRLPHFNYIHSGGTAGESHQNNGNRLIIAVGECVEIPHPLYSSGVDADTFCMRG